MFALIRRLYPGDGILRELVHQALGDGGESAEDIAVVDPAVALDGLVSSLEALHVQEALVGHVHCVQRTNIQNLKAIHNYLAARLLDM